MAALELEPVRAAAQAVVREQVAGTVDTARVPGRQEWDCQGSKAAAAEDKAAEPEGKPVEDNQAAVAGRAPAADKVARLPDKAVAAVAVAGTAAAVAAGRGWVDTAVAVAARIVAEAQAAAEAIVAAVAPKHKDHAVFAVRAAAP